MGLRGRANNAFTDMILPTNLPVYSRKKHLIIKNILYSRFNFLLSDEPFVKQKMLKECLTTTHDKVPIFKFNIWKIISLMNTIGKKAPIPEKHVSLKDIENVLQSPFKTIALV
jgi:hypothetical protein